MVPDHPLLSQAAALLHPLLTQQLPDSCSLEQMEAALHPRRVSTDRRRVARAEGWDRLGAPVWRVFRQRGGVRTPPPEVVVLEDGAAGIRSLRELYFPEARGLLWHLWEKVKERAREVFGPGQRERAWGAVQVVFARLKRGALAAARELIELWPVSSEWPREGRERLWALLERNQDVLGGLRDVAATGLPDGERPDREGE